MASSPAELAASNRIPRTPRPTRLKPLPGVDLQTRYYSPRSGGDFFDAVAVGPHVVFLLTDIAGRRSEAHTIAAGVQDTFCQSVQQLFGSPDTNESEAIVRLVQDVNATLIGASHRVLFAPAFLGCYNLPLGILTYIHAGCHPGVFRDRDGTRILDSGSSVPLGLFTHLTHEPAIQVFEPGAKLLLVTKGVVESRRQGAEFGIDRVASLLQDSTTDSAREICQATVQAAHDFAANRWSRYFQKLWFRKSTRSEDLTAAALVRLPQT